MVFYLVLIVRFARPLCIVNQLFIVTNETVFSLFRQFFAEKLEWHYFRPIAYSPPPEWFNFLFISGLTWFTSRYLEIALPSMCLDLWNRLKHNWILTINVNRQATGLQTDTNVAYAVVNCLPISSRFNEQHLHGLWVRLLHHTLWLSFAIHFYWNKIFGVKISDVLEVKVAV